MKAILVVAALTVLAGVPCHAANGVDLQQSCGTPGRAFWSGTSCSNFVNGVVAGLGISGHPGFCPPTNFDFRQALPIVRQFMANHPEALNNSEPRIVQMALQRAFPCF